MGDVLLDLNRLLYYKGGHYISKCELVAWWKLWLSTSHFTLAFPRVSSKSQNRGRPSSLPRPPWTRKMCRRSGRVRYRDVLTARHDLHPRCHRREVARRVRRGDTPKARYDGYAQLGAGEQGVQRRGVERGRRSVDGGEDQGTLVEIGEAWTAEPLYWAAKHGNVPAVRALPGVRGGREQVLTQDNRQLCTSPSSMAKWRW